jgi:hypothetical protein
LKDTDVAYLAGLIDGEGCFYYVKGTGGFQARMHITNTNRDILEWCKKITGYGYIHLKEKPKKLNHAQAFRWVCSGLGIKCLVPKLLPYLQIKKAQAEEIMRSFQQGLSREDNFKLKQEICINMHILNRTGP